MPLTMLGGYVSVVADLVERGVVKPRPLLSSRPKSSGAIDNPPVEVVRANVGVVPHSQGVQRVLKVCHCESVAVFFICAIATVIGKVTDLVLFDASLACPAVKLILPTLGHWERESTSLEINLVYCHSSIERLRAKENCESNGEVDYMSSNANFNLCPFAIRKAPFKIDVVQEKLFSFRGAKVVFDEREKAERWLARHVQLE